jgi:LDH2 family malate/lactate/ureidoglycolate dehydrogenase
MLAGGSHVEEEALVERSSLPAGSVHLAIADVRRFVETAIAAVGLSADDAATVADVLISADLRGIRSHGVARLPYFLSRLHRGEVNPNPAMVFSQGSPTTAVLDADRGLGIVSARDGMRRAIKMAAEHGCGFVAVTRSSHFGYAGYWTAMAERQGYIGVAMSNGGGRTAPTFVVEGVLGTNPLSVAIPGREGATFNLDMATSMVATGKIETAIRDGRPVPAGWLHRDAGVPTLDERGKLASEYPMLPLGGDGEETGGHKGYGLALMVELLCGALSGSPLSARMRGSAHAASSVGHFLGALSVRGFREPDDVAADMKETFDVIRSARRAPGHDRIYIHGEPEELAERRNAELGIAVDPEVSRRLHEWVDRLELDVPWIAHPELRTT